MRYIGLSYMIGTFTCLAFWPGSSRLNAIALVSVILVGLLYFPEIGMVRSLLVRIRLARQAARAGNWRGVRFVALSTALGLLTWRCRTCKRWKGPTVSRLCPYCQHRAFVRALYDDER